MIPPGTNGLPRDPRPATRDFLAHTGATLPLIGGPMYPCSNPELVAAISATGAIGVVQPMALTYVHGWEFRAGLRHIRSLTDRPIGFNALIEGSSKTYRKRMEAWIRITLEEGVRFFITSLGNPRWVVDLVGPHGGVVYHDVTEAKWAEKGLAGGAQGLIAVNREAGGHAGGRSPAELFAELQRFDVPVVAAGGVGDAAGFRAMLDLGYAAVQCGTRFIATAECSARSLCSSSRRGVVAARARPPRPRPPSPPSRRRACRHSRGVRERSRARSCCPSWKAGSVASSGVSARSRRSRPGASSVGASCGSTPTTRVSKASLSNRATS